MHFLCSSSWHNNTNKNGIILYLSDYSFGSKTEFQIPRRHAHYAFETAHNSIPEFLKGSLLFSHNQPIILSDDLSIITVKKNQQTYNCTLCLFTLYVCCIVT